MTLHHERNGLFEGLEAGVCPEVSATKGGIRNSESPVHSYVMMSLAPAKTFLTRLISFGSPTMASACSLVMASVLAGCGLARI